MARKRERGNCDGDVWPRKNKQGKDIGYHASYWVDTPSGPKRRYVSSKNKGETRAALTKAKSGSEDGFLSDVGESVHLGLRQPLSEVHLAQNGRSRGSLRH
jgi:hypothetical protein